MIEKDTVGILVAKRAVSPSAGVLAISASLMVGYFTVISHCIGVLGVLGVLVLVHRSSWNVGSVTLAFTPGAKVMRKRTFAMRGKKTSFTCSPIFGTVLFSSVVSLREYHSSLQ